VRNATISGNGASLGVLAGGGLRVAGGTATLENVTIADNAGGNGAGLYKDAGTLTLQNVLLANEGPGGNCALGATQEVPTSAGNNLATESDPDCGLVAPSDRLGVDPQLSPLGDYGGPTLTMRPVAGSPAIDAGACLDHIATDQRGLARPGLTCDIGAVEYLPSDVTPDVLRPRGRLLRLRARGTRPPRLHLVMADPVVATADPCDATGEFAIEATGAGLRARRYPLDTTSWSATGKRRSRRACGYRSADRTMAIRITSGKRLAAKVTRPDLAIPLAADPRPLRIEIRHGDRRHCVEFGGKGPFTEDRAVVSRLAPAGGACPGEP
jgi:hypothetical protein